MKGMWQRNEQRNEQPHAGFASLKLLRDNCHTEPRNEVRDKMSCATPHGFRLRATSDKLAVLHHVATSDGDL